MHYIRGSAVKGKQPLTWPDGAAYSINIMRTDSFRKTSVSVAVEHAKRLPAPSRDHGGNA